MKRESSKFSVRWTQTLRFVLVAFFYLISQFYSFFTHAQSTPESRLKHSIHHYSKSLLGRKYISSPLGEGFGIDADSLIRFDAFDCTTYVETVLALALSQTLNLDTPITEILSKIRYINEPGVSLLKTSPKVDFTNRAHFTSLDWIPNLTRLGIALDITERIFAGYSKVLATEINKDAWYKRVHNITPKSVIPSAIVRLPIVEISFLRKNPSWLNRIPSGSIINFVGHSHDIKEKLGTDMDIAHQGIFINKQGRFFLRHAKSHQRGVVEEPFFDAVKLPYLKNVYAINVIDVRLPQNNP